MTQETKEIVLSEALDSILDSVIALKRRVDELERLNRFRFLMSFITLVILVICAFIIRLFF
jgi:hypothetical protein